jgi:hypothetical protein
MEVLYSLRLLRGRVRVGEGWLTPHEGQTDGLTLIARDRVARSRMILLGDPRGLMHTFDVPKIIIINKYLSFLHNKHVRQRDWLASVRSGPSE